MKINYTFVLMNNRLMTSIALWRVLFVCLTLALTLSPYLLSVTAAASEPTTGDFNSPSDRSDKLARAGDLDSRFGTGGKVVTDFAGGLDEAHNVVLQSDGKIVVAGDSGDASDEVTTSDFGLARYNPDGSLDAGFGTGGKVTADFAKGFDQVLGLALQSDGRIIAAGYAKTKTGKDWGVARFNTDGSLDSSFGTGGKVTTDFANNFDSADAVVVQNDGRIIIAGFATTSTNMDFALVRYNRDGSLDSSFGNGGKVTTDFAKGADNAPAVALQSDGKIIAAGRARTSWSGFDFALVRYNRDGSLDSSFGKGGKVTTDFGGGAEGIRAMAIQSDSRIVVAGFTNRGETNLNFAVARYQSDGSLDSNFGKDGKVITDFALNFEDAAHSVALQSDGRIVVVGHTVQGGTNYDFALARYHTDGSLDSSFGNQGLLTTDLGTAQDWPFCVAIQKDGHLVVVGRLRNVASDYDFAIVRYKAFPFDIKIQDERSGDLIQFNSQIGDYRFTKGSAGGLAFNGRGLVTQAKCKITLTDSPSDSTIIAQVNPCKNLGKAKITRQGQPTIAIVDAKIGDHKLTKH
ncbi:MAG: hypothetical protein HY231_22300 [Acidobacteria bacterium]|nr:hypothetical protein [Acidobacteriota bacterium]